MPLLKAQTHQRASKDAVVLDLGDLGRQAAKLRAIAEAKAETILARARDEAEQLTTGATEAGDRRGYAEGLERGRAEGLEQGKTQALQQHAQQLQQVQQNWSTAIAEYEQRFLDCEREATATALQLAVKLAEKVIHRCVDTENTLIVEQVRAALAYVLEPTRVKVRVHPDDRAPLAEAMPGLVDELDQVAHAEVVDDADVSRGGCVVHAGPATIDAQVETQLDRLASLLLGHPRPCPESANETTEPQDQAEPESDPSV